MKAAYLLATGLFLAAVSCERHEWEEVRTLHESHGEHGEHADAGGESSHTGGETPDDGDHEGHDH